MVIFGVFTCAVHEAWNSIQRCTTCNASLGRETLTSHEFEPRYMSILLVHEENYVTLYFSFIIFWCICIQRPESQAILMLPWGYRTQREKQRALKVKEIIVRAALLPLRALSLLLAFQMSDVFISFQARVILYCVFWNVLLKQVLWQK